MKTRMFQTTGATEFSWVYNPDDPNDPKNMTIDKFYSAYIEGGNKKLEVPPIIEKSAKTK